MALKLLGVEYTNEILLTLLPFETGYLLRVPEEGEVLTKEEELRPCENSVTLAVMLRSLEFHINPHALTSPPTN